MPAVFIFVPDGGDVDPYTITIIITGATADVIAGIVAGAGEGFVAGFSPAPDVKSRIPYI